MCHFSLEGSRTTPQGWIKNINHEHVCAQAHMPYNSNAVYYKQQVVSFLHDSLTHTCTHIYLIYVAYSDRRISSYRYFHLRDYTATLL